jgi:hypothetical protein
MSTVLKVLLTCLICLGFVTAIVYAIKWLW